MNSQRKILFISLIAVITIITIITIILYINFIDNKKRIKGHWSYYSNQNYENNELTYELNDIVNEYIVISYDKIDKCIYNSETESNCISGTYTLKNNYIDIDLIGGLSGKYTYEIKNNELILTKAFDNYKYVYVFNKNN